MNILVLASRIPFPLEKGDKLRLYHQLRHLAPKHDITLCCLADKPIDEDQTQALSSLVKALHVLPVSGPRRWWRMMGAWLSSLPFQVTWFTDGKAQIALHTLLKEVEPDVVFCQLVRGAEYIKDFHEVPKVLDYMDALSAGMHRRSHMAQGFLGPLKRWAMRTEGNRLARYEARVFEYFDRHVIISRNDRLLIPHRDRDTVDIVPNGVDLQAFGPSSSPVEADMPTLLFTGNMAYEPNVDAAEHLVKDILPLVQTRPVRVVLAGAEPKQRVLDLASPEVEVTGWVDDIAAEYHRATLFVAPLRLGTGLQNKVLEAMCSEVPCVLSPHAFSPLGMPSEGHAVVCGDPQSFATAIDQLLSDPSQQHHMAQQAKAQIQKNFSWESHVAGLEQILKDAAQ